MPLMEMGLQLEGVLTIIFEDCASRTAELRAEIIWPHLPYCTSRVPLIKFDMATTLGVPSS